jgi:3-oxoacyl-[acyl-carrier protein] reductase
LNSGKVDRAPLAGLNAIVTGASRGIGAAIAHRLATSGAAVALLARDPDALSSVAQLIERAGSRALPISCNVSDVKSVEAAISKVEDVMGAPLLLINNAGYGGPFHTTDQVSLEEWEQIFATNVRSAFLFCRRLLPHMRDAGFGRVVNIASILGLSGAARSSTYAAAKHALVGYTKSIAQEWGQYGITCNALCPGYVTTAMRGKDGETPESSLISRIPAGRLATPQEIAFAVDHLCRLESSYTNGACQVVDGGLLAGLPE